MSSACTRSWRNEQCHAQELKRHPSEGRRARNRSTRLRPGGTFDCFVSLPLDSFVKTRTESSFTNKARAHEHSADQEQLAASPKPELERGQPRAGQWQIRSGLVFTRPKSRTMRVTRQLRSRPLRSGPTRSPSPGGKEGLSCMSPEHAPDGTSGPPGRVVIPSGWSRAGFVSRSTFWSTFWLPGP